MMWRRRSAWSLPPWSIRSRSNGQKREKAARGSLSPSLRQKERSQTPLNHHLPFPEQLFQFPHDKILLVGKRGNDGCLGFNLRHRVGRCNGETGIAKKRHIIEPIPKSNSLGGLHP